MIPRIVAASAFVATVAAAAPALLPQELFVQQTGLEVALQLPEPVMHVGQDPRFALRFENTGSRVLYLSPSVEPRVSVTRADGTPVPPIITGIAERAAARRIKAADLIALQHGKSWVVPVSATSYDSDAFSAYAEHGFTKESGWVLLLPPGRYVARFAYINAPDYGGSYDPYEMPRGIWEGRMEAEPVAFTVVAPTPEQLAAETLRLGRPDRASLLRLLASSPANLVDEFIARPESRPHIIRVARVHGEDIVPRLLKALDSIQSPERATVIYSPEFSWLLRDAADCTSLQFLTAELASTRGDVLAYVQPVFEKSALRCPDVRERLRAIVRDTTQPPSARSNAAALLGTFKNSGDIPLLAELLDAASSDRSNPLPRGAAVGLATVGGQRAREALTGALSNDRIAAVIGAEAINRLGAIGGPDIVEPLIAALSSANPNIVISALGGLRIARQQTAAPRLLEFLRHRNPTIRSYAAGAIRATGDDGARVAMRAAVRDVDENVQQEALFYLAEHGDSSGLEIFLDRLESRNQYVREAARKGVARFGTAVTFPRVRKLLDASATVAGSAQAALSALSFVDGVPRLTPRQWDEWYARHRATTRTQWAREALDGLRQMRPYEMRWSFSAISYLADQGAATFQEDFERAATSRRAMVRVEAARAIARVDRRRAAALLLGEFDGRLISGCELANRALNELAGADRRVDCTDPADRRRARDEWTHGTSELFR